MKTPRWWLDQLFKARAKIVTLEAELAKAWEAGRDAAADDADWCRDEGIYSVGNHIRALQPPGGKAK